jgi:hypothetical protein
MKKVLIIGHFWPYRGGSVRIFGLAKYLFEFGWNPVVLTGPLQQKPSLEFRVIETDYQGFLGNFATLLGLNPRNDVSNQLKNRFEKISFKSKSFLKFFYNIIKEIFAYPDEDKNWKPFALKAAEQFLKNEKIDAIISVWPYTSHLIAKDLKEKYQIPWLADFPDPWSQNHYYPYSFIRKYFDKKLELKTISKADAITAAAPLYQAIQEKLHKRKVILIPQGFDPEDLSKNNLPLKGKFTITYTGTIYKGKQNPEKIFTAIKNLISKKFVNYGDFEVNFYGAYQDWLKSLIEKHELEKIVKQQGKVSREESLKKQRESQVLLYLNWEDPKEKGVYASKIFEYLSSRRPILAAGGFPHDYIEKILIDTKAGVYATTVKEIEERLFDFYKEYKEKGIVSYRGDLEEIKKYSYREMARKFADILNQITKYEK